MVNVVNLDSHIDNTLIKALTRFATPFLSSNGTHNICILREREREREREKDSDRDR